MKYIFCLHNRAPEQLKFTELLVLHGEPRLRGIVNYCISLRDGSLWEIARKNSWVEPYEYYGYWKALDGVTETATRCDIKRMF